MKNRLIEFIKFSMSSLGSTVVDLGLFALLVFFLRGAMPHVYITIATIIARIVSLIVNYNINAKIVFKNEEQRNFPFFKYNALAVFEMLVSALLVTMLFDYLQWNETIVKVFVDGSLFFFGYLIQRNYIF